MIVIGLCGGSGSGKSTVSLEFRRLGAEILDADAIYHELTSHMSECLCAIRDAFGEDVIRDGALDRAKLSGVVFGSDQADAKRALLNSITHRYVTNEITDRLAKLRADGVAMAVLDVPLLFEADIDKLCDFLVCVTAPLELRIERLLLRDGMTRERALLRIQAQLTDDFLIANTDFHILNNSSLDFVRQQVNEIINKINIKVGN
jgi:dephospho-CoA kinase